MIFWIQLRSCLHKGQGIAAAYPFLEISKAKDSYIVIIDQGDLASNLYISLFPIWACLNIGHP